MSEREVTVNFPHGERRVKPFAWQREEGQPLKPVFDIPGYRVVETLDGKYIAHEDPI